MNCDCIKENILLKDYSYYKTGGYSKYFAEPINCDQLICCIEYALKNNQTFYVIGNATNILFSDNGYNGLIIDMNNFSRHIINKNNEVYAGAGITLDELIQFTLENNMTGLENLSGIPGTLGGAIFMNAGAYTSEVKDFITYVKVLDKDHNIRKLYADDINFRYRDSGLHDYIVLGAAFTLNYNYSADKRKLRDNILKQRNDKQPLEFPSCGSVFKRPVNGYAGQLIEECGLKGFTIGGAKISEKHANFIINFNNATSTDIYNIIIHTKNIVLDKKSVLLEEEVKLVGF